MASRVCYRRGDPPAALLEREWLVTNGLGGYASCTVSCAPTRRHHGYLIAALPPPHGRVLYLNHLEERARFDDDGRELVLCSEAALDELQLEDGLPLWRHRGIEKRLFLPHGRNVAVVSWRAFEPLTLRVRPSFQIRAHDGMVAQSARSYPVAIDGASCQIDAGDLPRLRLAGSRGEWRAIEPQTRTVRYQLEADRGYDCEGPLVAPCELLLILRAGEEAQLTISAEPAPEEPNEEPNKGSNAAPNPVAARAAEEARRRALVGPRTGLAAELALAADQFVIRKGQGRTVIAGYHWFTDWGRDTMISLEGLCLTTGRFTEAAAILSTFAAHVRDGLIPNLFPEGEAQGLYHTADATLWFFHAVDRYTKLSKDGSLLPELLPILTDIVRHHLRGTRFGIRVDPADGLLRQGEEGYQLTWMDAKIGDWVVTPRRGKAVELNALFYNALSLLSEWLGGDPELAAHAARLRESFNARFFHEERGHLYDVLDPDDASLRPNQLFAISLPHPVLDRARWKPVLQAVRKELLTPVGLRSLGPREPGYRPRYGGDLRSRDAAYHQGTVWAWLIGPFADAWQKAFGPEPSLLEGFDLGAYGLGTIAEIFDGDPPHAPRGCIAQAWSVAEVLRCLG
jgi:glycogen debranching enzyme